MRERVGRRGVASQAGGGGSWAGAGPSVSRLGRTQGEELSEETNSRSRLSSSSSSSSSARQPRDTLLDSSTEKARTSRLSSSRGERERKAQLQTHRTEAPSSPPPGIPRSPCPSLLKPPPPSSCDDDLHEVAADAPDELHVALHDGDALGVQRAQVRVLEQVDEVPAGERASEGTRLGVSRRCPRREGPVRERERGTHASVASCNASSAELCHLRPTPSPSSSSKNSVAISRTRRANGRRRTRRSVVFW